MAESKGIPWKGKAAQQGGSLAATDPNYQAPAAPAAAPAASAAPAAPAPSAPAAAAPGGGGGKGIPWKGKAAQQGGSAAATAATAAAPAAAPVAAGSAPQAAPAAAPGGEGGKSIPWKGKAAAAAAATAPAAAPSAPAVPARAAGPTAPVRPVGPPPVVEALRGLVPDMKSEMRHGYAEVTVTAERLLAAARLAKHEYGFDYLSSITAVDWEDRFELLYHLYSYEPASNSACLVLRVSLPHEDNPLAPSLTPLWGGAEFQERDIYDLMGIKFVGHPDLRRILLSDDFPGHPLRKDFVFDYGFVVMHHLRSGAEGQADTLYDPPHIALAGDRKALADDRNGS